MRGKARRGVVTRVLQSGEGVRGAHTGRPRLDVWRPASRVGAKGTRRQRRAAICSTDQSWSLHGAQCPSAV